MKEKISHTTHCAGNVKLEVKEVSTKVAEKAFELVIPFLEEWKENNPQSTAEWVVDNNNKFNMYLSVQHIQIK